MQRIWHVISLKFVKKYPHFVKISSAVAILSGVGWITLQVQKTYEILNNALDTSVIHFMEPKLNEIGNDKDEQKLTKWYKTLEDNNTNKTWNALKFSYARRLLSLANSDNRDVRLKAVKQLSKLRNLDNWHYSLLAHMCDPRTAVGLARTEGVDLRFFVEPPYKYIMFNHQMIVNIMKEFLMSLHSQSQHVCMGYFISRAFVDVHEVCRLADHDSSSIELTKFIQSADDVLPTCLESILHHSSVENYAKDIVELNGLPLLMEIHNRFKNNIDVTITLCHIISNIALYPEYLDELFRSGWISVLAEWLRNPDIRISAPAAQALANLDSDENYDVEYLRRIYILHPFTRNTNNIDADVIFVHGLLGGVFYTWRQRDKNSDSTLGFIESFSSCDISSLPAAKSSDPVTRQYIQDIEEQKRLEWENLGRDYEIVYDDIPIDTNRIAKGPYSSPGSDILKCMRIDKFCHSQCWPRDWLPQDCKNVRIIAVNYDTKLSMWAPMCPAEQTVTNLEERSDEILSKLIKTGLGRRPIIWITHSMGGLIVKNMLCKALENNLLEAKNICLNTKGIVFYSTPHFGSRLANLNQATNLLLWPSVEVQELKEDSPHLIEIHEKFLDLTKKIPIKVISFVETKSTVVSALKFNFLFVAPKSANPGVGEYFEVPQDHLGICKPSNRQSFLYQKIVGIIDQIIKESAYHY